MKSAATLSVFTALISFAVTFICESLMIPYLRKKAKQPIYEGGPSWHISKSGTPTMGGLAFLISSVATLLPAAFFMHSAGQEENAYAILLTLVFSLLNASVGIADDITKLKHKENAGLSPSQKIILQLASATGFLFIRYSIFADGTKIVTPFVSLELGIIYYPIALIIILGIINCANLTDGVDGLAGSVALAVSFGLLLIFSESSVAVITICACIIGTALAFLIFNVHPAKIFMGDTGSLFLGAMLVSVAFTAESPAVIIPVGIIYVIEGVSVILQVLIFKISKRRLFKMAPIHHHFEKCGMSENKICALAIAVTLIFSVITFFIYR